MTLNNDTFGRAMVDAKYATDITQLLVGVASLLKAIVTTGKIGAAGAAGAAYEINGAKVIVRNSIVSIAKSDDEIKLVNNIVSNQVNIWNSIKATQPLYPGSVIPKSFELSVENGQKFWVHANRTKHLAEFAKTNAENFTLEAVKLSSQIQLRSLQSAVNTATLNGISYDKPILVGGWEIIFSKPRPGSALPVIKHALQK